MESKYLITKFAPESRKRQGKWLICQTCRQKFYVYPCRIKKGMVKFCGMKCYRKDGDFNPFHGKKHSVNSIQKMVTNPNRVRFGLGKQNPNHMRYGEYFSGSSLHWWQRNLKRTIGKCEKCGFSDKRILHVHHINKNRKENIRDNLILLCPNCHALIHYLDKSGLYNNMK